jgi:hypothetical protein
VTSPETVNSTQFGRAASQIEHEESQETPNWPRLGGARREMGSDYPTIMDRHVQGQLFDPGHLPSVPAHHQLPEQFARDPATWYHARIMNEKTARAPKGAGPEGFHAGSRPSAVQRVMYNARRRGVKEGMTGRVFPLRATGDIEPGFRSEPPASKGFYGKGGSIRHTDLAGAEKGYRYSNVVEDEGSISVGVPQRKGFLSTHREMVEGAKARGEYVHPNVAWAAKHYPEHTGERIVNPRAPYRSPEELLHGQQFWPGLGWS